MQRISSLALLFLVSTVVPAGASEGGLGSFIGLNPKLWHRGEYAVVVAKVEAIEVVKGREHSVILTPLATIAGLLDVTRVKHLKASAIFPSDALSDPKPPEAGDVVLCVLRWSKWEGEKETRLFIATSDLIAFIPGSSALVVVTGVDDPIVRDVTERLRVLRTRPPTTRRTTEISFPQAHAILSTPAPTHIQGMPFHLQVTLRNLSLSERLPTDAEIVWIIMRSVDDQGKPIEFGPIGWEHLFGEEFLSNRYVPVLLIHVPRDYNVASRRLDELKVRRTTYVPPRQSHVIDQNQPNLFPTTGHYTWRLYLIRQGLIEFEDREYVIDVLPVPDLNRQ